MPLLSPRRGDYNAFKRGYVYSYTPKESNNFSCEHLNQLTTSVYLLVKTRENRFAEAALAFLFP